MNIDFNINSLTIGEVEILEELTDTSIDKLFDANGKKGRMMRAVAFISARRDNPDFTWEEAGNIVIEADDQAGK